MRIVAVIEPNEQAMSSHTPIFSTMKTKYIKLNIIWAAALLLSLFQAVTAIGQQCVSSKIKLQHLSGTLSVGCTDVTVTSDGDVASGTFGSPCFTYGPYQIGGQTTSGSYIFTFSVPVQEVTIDIHALHNNEPTSFEEMSVEVNGVFYPLTSAGTPDGCNLPAVLWPSGTIRAPIGNSYASSKDIIISETIYSIKVSNNIFAGTPGGSAFNLYICCTACDTDAGTINATDIETCAGEAAVLPPSSQFALDANDILQYILFSNADSPKTSILATSSSPSFNFNPATMSLGASYYIAAIAGNELNGNVDISDPCCDVSNIIEVVWWPEPTVAFTSGADCLQPGECYSISLSFTGTPPFHFIGQVVLGGNVLTSVDATYNSPSQTSELCIPVTALDGPITVEALSLSDAHCTCD